MLFIQVWILASEVFCLLGFSVEFCQRSPTVHTFHLGFLRHVAAGDDLDDLMLLCEADITSKNPEKVRRYLANYQLVRQKMVDIEEKDRIRNFQPPVSGDEIMQVFGLEPCREVGEIKERLKNAILDGEIPNERDAAYRLMLEVAAEKGLYPQS